MTEKGPAPPPQGGGGGKKKRRKRGGAGGANNNAKDSNGGGGGGPPAASSAGRGGGKGGGGGKNKRRGGGGRGGGGGGGNSESSRFGKNASSPLQLPHVKVTIRNIGDAAKHGTMEGVMESVQSFLQGAFDGTGGSGSESDNAYMTAWQVEKEEFDSAKNMFAEASAASGGSGPGGGAASSSTTRAFSSGWVYQENPSPLPSGRFERLSTLPTTQKVVGDLMENKTEKRVSNSTTTNWIVDTAMSQMMAECGKNYLNFVGGRIVLDEESVVDVVLAERVLRERKKLEEAEKKKRKEAEAIAAAAAEAAEGDEGDENATAEDKEAPSDVETVTKAVEKLTTSDSNKLPPAKKQELNQSPAIRVRILAITLAKTSKRRGEIAGKVQLAMYPPDPCLLFKEMCREAGTMAAEKQLEKKNAEVDRKNAELEKQNAALAEAALAEAALAEASLAEAAPAEASKEGDDGVEKDDAGVEGVSSESKDEAKSDEQTEAQDIKPKPTPALMMSKERFPQIPYYPLLSPAERSRAVARSRVLMHRTVEAMKLHSAAQAKASHGGQSYWEVSESASQKTWKGRPHPMVGSLMAGGVLRDLVVEHEKEYAKEKSSGAGAKKKGRGFYGDSRADRYDSTIENSEDYKAFMESLNDGSAPKEAAEKDAKKNGVETKKDEPPELDEEGRPLSAIVLYFRGKQEEERKVKAEQAAAVAKARAAAAAAKEKVRKDKLKVKKNETKKRKKDVSRSKKGKSLGKGGTSSSSSGRPSSAGGMPPPGAMLLKKKVPPSGFG